MHPAKSTSVIHELSSVWLEATTADHHLHPIRQDTWTKAKGPFSPWTSRIPFPCPQRTYLECSQ